MKSERPAYGIENYSGDSQARSAGGPLPQDAQDFLKSLQDVREGQKVFAKKQVGLLQNEAAVLQNAIFFLSYQKDLLSNATTYPQYQEEQVDHFLQEKVAVLREQIADFIQHQKNIFHYNFLSNPDIAPYAQLEQTASLEDQIIAQFNRICDFIQLQEDFFECDDDLLWDPNIALQHQENRVDAFIQRQENFTQHKNNFIEAQKKFLGTFDFYTDFLQKFSAQQVFRPYKEQASLIQEQLGLLCNQIYSIEDTQSFAQFQGFVVQHQEKFEQNQENIPQDHDTIVQAQKAFDEYQEVIDQAKEVINEAKKVINQVDALVEPQAVARYPQAFAHRASGPQRHANFFSNSPTQLKTHETPGIPPTGPHSFNRR